MRPKPNEWQLSVSKYLLCTIIKFNPITVEAASKVTNFFHFYARSSRQSRWPFDLFCERKAVSSWLENVFAVGRCVGRRRDETKSDTRNRSLVDISSCHCLLVCAGDYLKIDRRETTLKPNTIRNPYEWLRLDASSVCVSTWIKNVYRTVPFNIWNVYDDRPMYCDAYWKKLSWTGRACHREFFTTRPLALLRDATILTF